MDSVGTAGLERTGGGIRVREAMGDEEGEDGTVRGGGLTSSMIGWSAKGSSGAEGAARGCRRGGSGAARRGMGRSRERLVGTQRLLALSCEVTETFGSLLNDDACADWRGELTTKAGPKVP